MATRSSSNLRRTIALIFHLSENNSQVFLQRKEMRKLARQNGVCYMHSSSRTKGNFCQSNLRPCEVYAVLLEIMTFPHIWSMNKAKAQITQRTNVANKK